MAKKARTKKTKVKAKTKVKKVKRKKPEGPKAVWEMQTGRNSEEVLEYLEEGFEPFAVSEDGFVYMKKKVRP